MDSMNMSPNMSVLPQDYFDELICQLRWAREIVRPEGHTFTAASGYSVIICWLILHGEGTIKLTNKQTYEIGTGDLVIIPTDVYIERFVAKTKIQYLSLGLNAQVWTIELTKFYGIPEVIRLPKDTSLQPLINAWEGLVDQFQSTVGDLQKDNNLYVNFSSLDTALAIACMNMQAGLYQWLFQVFLLIKPFINKELVVVDDRFIEISRYMNRNFHLNITMQHLSDQFHISQSHLNLIFKKTIGVPPMKYVRSLRINKAKELLLNSSLSILEISSKVGYIELSQFSRAFRNSEGMSPRHFRDQRNRLVPF